MLNFILGVLVGGLVGFVVCAICTATGSNESTEVAWLNESEKDNNSAQLDKENLTK